MSRTTELIGNDFERAMEWQGFVVGSDGCLYATPGPSYEAKRILKVDPTDDSTTLVGPELGDSCMMWAGSLPDPDGWIYGFSTRDDRNDSKIRKFNPATEEVVIVTELPFQSGYLCAAFAPNGILYILPKRGRIVRYDPSNGLTSLIGDDLPTVNGWEGAVLAGDGCIYFIPSMGAPRVIRLDPTDDSITFIGVEFDDGDEYYDDYGPKWQGGVLGPDGNVYGISCNSFKLLKINIATQSTSLVLPCTDDDNQWEENNFTGGAVGHDGCIYMVPGGAEFVTRYDPDTDTTSNVGESLDGSYYGGVLAPNGYIYAPPSWAKQVLKIKSFGNWVYLKPRLLVDKRRATRRIIQFDDDLNVVQHFIIHSNYDIFCTVLEFLG